MIRAIVLGCAVSLGYLIASAVTIKLLRWPDYALAWLGAPIFPLIGMTVQSRWYSARRTIATLFAVAAFTGTLGLWLYFAIVSPSTLRGPLWMLIAVAAYSIVSLTLLGMLGMIGIRRRASR